MINPDRQVKPRFQDYEKLARKLHFILLKRVRARGVKVDPEDLYQEICVLWCKCRDTFDPEKAKFSTFFWRSVINAFEQGNLVRNANGDRRQVLPTISLNQPAYAGDEGDDLVETIEDEGAIDPEARLLRTEAVERTLSRSPLLACLLELSANTPPDLLAHLQAMEAQRQYAESQGLVMDERPPTTLTPELLRRLFQFNWRERLLAKISTEFVGA